MINTIMGDVWVLKDDMKDEDFRVKTNKVQDIIIYICLISVIFVFIGDEWFDFSKELNLFIPVLPFKVRQMLRFGLFPTGGLFLLSIFVSKFHFLKRNKISYSILNTTEYLIKMVSYFYFLLNTIHIVICFLNNKLILVRNLNVQYFIYFFVFIGLIITKVYLKMLFEMKESEKKVKRMCNRTGFVDSNLESIFVEDTVIYKV